MSARRNFKVMEAVNTRILLTSADNGWPRKAGPFTRKHSKSRLDRHTTKHSDGGSGLGLSFLACIIQFRGFSMLQKLHGGNPCQAAETTRETFYDSFSTER